MKAHHQELVRERAYQLWEDEGHPEGAGQRHWLQAESDIAGAEQPAISDGKGSPAQEALAESSAAQPKPRARRKAV